MTTDITIEQTTSEVIPTGDYAAIVDDVAHDDGQYGPQVKLTFRLTGEAYLPSGEPISTKRLLGWASATFSRSSKLYRWTAAALGRPIAPGEAFSAAAIMGKPVTLTVLVKVKEDGSEYNKIDEVRPSRPALAAGQNNTEAAHTAAPVALPV